MVDEARPYAIHSDSECDRLEKQAVLAGLENHLRHVQVPKTARILDAGCGSGAMARCFASHFAEASVIGVDISEDYVVYAQGRAKEDGLQNVEFRQGSVFDCHSPMQALTWSGQSTSCSGSMTRRRLSPNSGA